MEMILDDLIWMIWIAEIACTIRCLKQMKHRDRSEVVSISLTFEKKNYIEPKGVWAPIHQTKNPTLHVQ